MPVGRGWLGAGSRAGSWEQSGSGTERAELWYLFSVQGQQRWLRSGVGNEGKKIKTISQFNLGSGEEGPAGREGASLWGVLN